MCFLRLGASRASPLPPPAPRLLLDGKSLTGSREPRGNVDFFKGFFPEIHRPAESWKSVFSVRCFTPEDPDGPWVGKRNDPAQMRAGSVRRGLAPSTPAPEVSSEVHSGRRPRSVWGPCREDSLPPGVLEAAASRGTPQPQWGQVARTQDGPCGSPLPLWGTVGCTPGPQRTQA